MVSAAGWSEETSPAGRSQLAAAFVESETRSLRVTGYVRETDRAPYPAATAAATTAAAAASAIPITIKNCINSSLRDTLSTRLSPRYDVRNRRRFR
ncbi:hypothetical protein RB195_006567 [Necator americanus]|uniref:Uncharacterized protein n=1 Tax=Necator americanus TaxID=51031 RepID=A0ABR1BW72_NECAM